MPETINQDGTPVRIESLVMRYHSPVVHEHDSIEDAVGFIGSGEDYGECSGIGVMLDGQPHLWTHGEWEDDGFKKTGRLPNADEADYMRRLYTEATV